MRRQRSHQQSVFYRDAPLARANRINFSHTKYYSFAEMINYLNTLAINFPDRVRVQPIGTTHEGRQIALIKVFN